MDHAYSRVQHLVRSKYSDALQRLDVYAHRIPLLTKVTELATLPNEDNTFEAVLPTRPRRSAKNTRPRAGAGALRVAAHLPAGDLRGLRAAPGAQLAAAGARLEVRVTLRLGHARHAALHSHRPV